MGEGLEHSIIISMSNELKEAIKSESARRKTTAAELILAQMQFCLPRNIEKSISSLCDDIPQKKTISDTGSMAGN